MDGRLRCAGAKYLLSRYFGRAALENAFASLPQALRTALADSTASRGRHETKHLDLKVRRALLHALGLSRNRAQKLLLSFVFLRPSSNDLESSDCQTHNRARVDGQGNEASISLCPFTCRCIACWSFTIYAIALGATPKLVGGL